MSVEGVPSVDDVAREMAPHILYGTLGEDLARASEAVHALYAPHLARIQGLSAELIREKAKVAKAYAEAARYREALEYYATVGTIAADQGSRARAALAEPKEQD